MIQETELSIGTLNPIQKSNVVAQREKTSLSSSATFSGMKRAKCIPIVNAVDNNKTDTESDSSTSLNFDAE